MKKTMAILLGVLALSMSASAASAPSRGVETFVCGSLRFRGEGRHSGPDYSVELARSKTYLVSRDSETQRSHRQELAFESKVDDATVLRSGDIEATVIVNLVGATTVSIQRISNREWSADCFNLKQF